MSEENVEVVRRMYEAFQGGDAATAEACFDPEVILDARVRIDGAIGHGRDALGSGGGRITRMTLHRTPEEALQAAGLSE